MNTVEERKAQWEQICLEFRESGMTRIAFCKERNIALSTLGYWLNPARGTSPSFQKRNKQIGTELVPVATVSIGRQSVLRLRIGECLVAELELPSDESVIRSVLRAARSV